MSDAEAKSGLERPESKRSIKLTPKGICFYIQTCQENRSAKFKQAKRFMDKIRGLIESGGKSDAVNAQLALFIQCYEEALKVHETFMELPLPENDPTLNSNIKNFEDKIISCQAFTEEIKEWLSKSGKSYSQPKEPHATDCLDDGINPEDSISNVLSVKSSNAKSRATGASTSSSKARAKAESERMALLKRSELLKKKHEIELQEERLRRETERLRREKEQLELETDLAANTAKLEVLESKTSQCGSKRSDGMNSYLKKSKAQNSTGLNPQDSDFVPHANILAFPAAPVVRPKQRPAAQMNVMPPQVRRAALLGHQTGNNLNSQTQTGNNKIDVVNIMQKQNEITALLVQQNVSSTLPARNLPVFDGDPLQYQSFIRAFENGVEMKTDNAIDCLHFLEQYTRGHPRDLVQSCQHLPPDQGYQRAKSLLAQHFGDEHKIASAYMEKIMNWTPVKREDVKGLQALSLFLRGCSNMMEQVMYLSELDIPSNMRSIILKLPYNLREKWRNVACDLLEKRGYRAMFNDLVNFIEKQVKIALDPVFGNIQDPYPSSHTKASSRSQLSERKESSFATNVTPVSQDSMAQPSGHAMNNTNSFHSCLFCLQNNHTLNQCSEFKAKEHSDKINFIKNKGICFGCLRVGHISKNCRRRLNCHVCHKKHPGVLHIEKQNTGTSVNPSTDSNVPSQTCSHIGAGVEHSTFSIVAVKVRSKLTNKTTETYAFLDPGSSGTFCTENMARKLKLRGEKTNILLKTMGQQKVVDAHILSGLEVSGMDAEDFIELPDVLTQKSMPVSTLNIPRQADIAQWPYLKDVKLHDIHADVELLIGTDASKILEPWQVINSQNDGPYATRTRVGWLVYNGGSCRSKRGYSSVAANYISVEHLQGIPVKQHHHDLTERASEEQIEMSRVDLKLQNELLPKLERIAVIKEATDVDQGSWKEGPEFLYKSKEQWPVLDDGLQLIPAADPEIKRDQTQPRKAPRTRLALLLDSPAERVLTDEAPFTQRQKWTERRNLVPGDIVLMAHATAPREGWMMGRVLEVRPDAMGHARSVHFKMKTGVLERPVTKLCLLLEAGVD